MALPFDPAAEPYVNLATFRRDGREVRTPVWIAADRRDPAGRTFFVYTNRTSGKVKRVRANGRARLAACDWRGNVHGEWIDARAELVGDDAERERGLAAVVAKYGWQMRLALGVSRLSGRHADRAALRLQV